PRALVFKTMTDPALIPKWWGPHGYTTIVDKMELRPGGEWRFVHRAPNGRETAFHGVYREIAPPERLVYTFDWEGMPGHVSTETIRFEERDGKTAMINTARYASVQDLYGVLNSAPPQGGLVDPAVNGTRNVLGACQRAATVKRVVLTSSMAAITDEPESDHVLTESDWNEKSSLERNPYYYSKTLAERAAWTFMDERNRTFDLVVINPFLVVGPSIVPGLNTSNQIFVDLLNGTYPGIVNLTWGFVDVRDVADAHVRAMETPSARGRYICAGETA